MADQNNERPRFAIYIHHGGYPESLEPLKIYQILPDPEAAQHRQLRVIDESGEDYHHSGSDIMLMENFRE